MDIEIEKEMQEIKKESHGQWLQLFGDLRNYFSRYGGWRCFFSSPFSQSALIVTLGCFGIWMQDSWSTIPLQVLPNLLGFTLAAFALLLGFGNEDFRKVLAMSSKNAPSHRANILLTTSAVFFHFILIQVLAILFALVGYSHPLRILGSYFADDFHWLFQSDVMYFLRNIGAFLGFMLFSLSLTNALAAAINIFHIASWYVEFMEEPEGK